MDASLLFSRVLEKSSSLPIPSLVPTILHLDVDTRKILLKTSRIQPSLATSSRWYQRHEEALKKTIYVYTHCTGTMKNDLSRRASSLYDFILQHATFFHCPTLAGFVSMLVRYLPYVDYSSVQDTKEKTIIKEISAATSTGYSFEDLDYAAILSSRSPNDGLSFRPDYPRPQLESEISNLLTSSILRFAQRTDVLVPDVGKKTIPTLGLYHGLYRPFQHLVGGTVRTLADIERIYNSTGFRLSGITELRSVWRPNDLKPRVYYARGPDAHFASSVVQKIFNVMVDALPVTHRHIRFHDNQVEFSDDDILMIYDYSSFTSSMVEVRRFVYALAAYFQHVTIRVLDSFNGVVDRSIGDILIEYVETVNLELRVDASELLDVEEMVFYHSTGALGIPGNISSCTLLHGIHLAVICGSLLRGKCVGDDAIVAFCSKFESKESIVDAISALGEVAMEKAETWDFNPEPDDSTVPMERWDYIKRPFCRFLNTTDVGSLITWPGIDTVGIRNPFHRPKNNIDDPIIARRMFIRQHSRFLESIPSGISDESALFVERVMSWMFRKHGLRPRGGIDKDTSLVYPSAFERCFEFRNFLYSLQGSGVSVRMYTNLDITEVLRYSLHDQVVVSNSSIVRYLIKLGFLHVDVDRRFKEVMVDDLIRSDSLELYVRNRELSIPVVVVRDLPFWAMPYMR